VNVLMISLDTLRADHLSAYGYPRLTSPHLDRLAAQGAVFRNCLAPHIPTHPGHTTVFTGRDVFDHQIVTHGGQLDLDPGIPLLAERFQQAGYFTAAADNLGRWFSRGFDLYEGYRWDTDPKGRWPKAEAVNRAADKVFAQIAAQSKPFFCFLHYWDVHTPYLPPDPFWGMFYDGDPYDPSNHSLDAMWEFEPFRWYFHEWMPGVRDVEFPKSQYDAELAYMDTCLAHMFYMLHARGLDRDTLVVVFADHGEELDEHRMWFDHHGLYETNVHVPLIFWAPGRVPARTLFGPVSHYDIAPTVLEAAGLPPDPQAAGRSLWPVMRGGPDTGTWDALYLTECTWMRKHAWRTREWKLILAKEPDFHHCPPVELYHLPSDPLEQRNLAEERPDVVEELRAALEAHVARRVAETGRPAPIDVQGITLRRIGRVETAVPANMKLPPAEEAPAAEAEAAATAAAPKRRRRRTGASAEQTADEGEAGARRRSGRRGAGAR
jgi:arylsulfatase A-like enzyme